MNKAALIIAKEGYSTKGNTKDQVIDSRRLTFKYLDREHYNNGVYPAQAGQEIDIKHELGYTPSVRIYAYGNLFNPLTGVQSTTPILIQPENSFADPHVIVSADNLYVYLNVISASLDIHGNVIPFDIYILIGADNLDSDPDEVVRQ